MQFRYRFWENAAARFALSSVSGLEIVRRLSQRSMPALRNRSQKELPQAA